MDIDSPDIDGGTIDGATIATTSVSATTLAASSTLDVTGATGLDGAVTLGDALADVVTVSGTIAGASPLVFEGTTADEYETTFAITDGADYTITFPGETGTVALAANVLALSGGTMTGAVDFGSQASTNMDIDSPDIDGGTIDGATIATSDITVGAAKTLDVSAGTIKIGTITSQDTHDTVPTDQNFDDATSSTPAGKGAGWSSYVKDSSSGNVFLVMSDGTNWWYFAGTQAA